VVLVWTAYLAALAVLAVHGAHRLFLTITAWRRRGDEPVAPALPAELPVVTVQLPLYNEAAVAARLLDAVAALDWPADRLEVQVLDDSTDETREVVAAGIARLRARGLDAHHRRRADRAGFKAGALEAARASARGELLLVLDADFVPRPSLLRDVAGHFADPRVGLVQIRWDHLNRSVSPLTDALALLLDGHFAVEQPARAWTGRIFNFNGTAGVWRAVAVEDAGGWHADTLTEDLDLSYRAALRGWRFVYRRCLAAPAELPATMRAFKSQQFRWAKGSIECARKLLPALARAPASRRVRLEGAMHLTQNLAYVALLVLLLTAAPALASGDRASPRWLDLGGAGLTALVLGTYAVVAAHGTGLGARGILRSLAHVPVLAALTAGIALHQSRAVLEGVLGRRTPFIRTPKDGAVGATRARPRYRAPRDLLWLAEALLALHLAAGATLAASRTAYLPAAFLALFATGCLWVATATALDR